MMYRFIPFIVFFWNFLSCSLTWAFTLSTSTGAAFDSDRVEVNVSANRTFCPNAGVTAEELLSLAETAVNQYWNTVPTSRLHLLRGGLKNVNNAFETEGLCTSQTNGVCTPNPALNYNGGIIIACNDDTGPGTENFPSPQTLAASLPINVEGRAIKGAVILINDEGVGVGSFATLGREEKIAVIAHEIGHALGLGHSEFRDSLMYHASISSRRRLGWDDFDGLTYLYPRLDTPLALVGCGQVDFKKNQNTPPGPSTLTFLATFLLGLVLMIWGGPMLKNRKRWLTLGSVFVLSTLLTIISPTFAQEDDMDYSMSEEDTKEMDLMFEENQGSETNLETELEAEIEAELGTPPPTPVPSKAKPIAAPPAKGQLIQGSAPLYQDKE